MVSQSLSKLLTGFQNLLTSLPKWPSAKEAAEFMLLCLFCLHGLFKHLAGGLNSLLIFGICFTASWKLPQTWPADRLNAWIRKWRQHWQHCAASPPAVKVHHGLVHNTLPCSATGLSPFQCSWGYQPPLFTNFQTRGIPAPCYPMVKRSRFPGRTSMKLAPWFVGLFPVSKVINSAAVHLCLPQCKWHPTFHVSHLNPTRRASHFEYHVLFISLFILVQIFGP